MHLLLCAFLGCAADAPAPAPTAPVAPTPAAAPAPAAPAAAAAATYKNVDADGLKAALDAGTVPVLVDVRSPEEYAAGHVPKAINLPIGDLDARMAELAPHKGGEVWLICQSGGRSSRAAAKLAAAGYTPVNVSDGTGSWKKKGYPIE